MDIENQLKTIIDSITQKVIESVKAEVESALASAITERSKQFDDLTVEAFGKVIKENLRSVDFPKNSVPISSLNFEKEKLSGDNIRGGIISNFGSTGIDDRATDCQLTILDSDTIVENNLTAREITVKGTARLEGDVIISGNIPTDAEFFQTLVRHSRESVVASINDSLFDGYSQKVFDLIKYKGIDLNSISVNGKEIIRDQQLTPNVIESSLQKVGTLKSLQVSGEMIASDTLYSTKRRVGINTIEPTAALTVWDEEIELQIGKRKKDAIWINTPRAQKVILSSNSSENLVLHEDGSVQAQKLKIGDQDFSSSRSVPNYESTKGTVVFNANPSLGGPLGWVCLGGSSWANFGIID